LAESATPLAYVVLSCRIAILVALSHWLMKLTSAGASASSRLTMRNTLSYPWSVNFGLLDAAVMNGRSPLRCRMSLSGIDAPEQ
jgi:hypothetical protein